MSVLAVRGLEVEVGAGRHRMMAVDGADLDVPAGGILGLVGESGSGKSTLARALIGLMPAKRGEILLDGTNYAGARGRRRRELRRRVQLVFQDPRASLNPRMTIGEALREALERDGLRPRRSMGAEVARILEQVSLDPAYARARPAALSGGECQRVSLARALAVRPDLVIADEITSSLDASVQASVLNLLAEIRAQTGLSLVVISHNLAVVRYLSDEIAVMYLGRIVERASTAQLLGSPAHPYTRTLLDSVALTGFAADEPLADAEPPDPQDPPSGCRFRTRCAVGPLVEPARTICTLEDPGPDAARRVNRAACHFAAAAEKGGD